MKLLRLDLLAFGPFTGICLDLSAGKEGLHLIHGPNEAGKSSSLRALRQLFFGIPTRCSDNFLHSYPDLRIGASLRHGDGSVLEVIRRKANSKTLRGPDDNSVVDADQLQALLGGVDQQTFETMFGIDHPTLVAGGKEILKSDGQFGEVLFAASAGLSGLRKAQEGLVREMADLFLPRGNNPRINQLVQKYVGFKKELKESQLNHEEWSRHEQAFQEADKQRGTLQNLTQQKRREQSRLQRIGQALKPIAARKGVLQQLEAYRDAPALSADFSKARQQAENEAIIAESAAREATEALAEIETKLSNLRLPEDLLAHAGRIDELIMPLGSYKKILADLPQRKLQMRTAEHDAKEILRSLGRIPDLEQAESLRLTKEEKGRIQKLGQDYQGLLANCDNAREEVESLARRSAEARRKLADVPLPADPASLRAEIRQAQKLGELEEALAQKEHALSLLQRQINLDLSRLPYWQGRLHELEKMSPLGEETIQERATAFNEKSGSLAHLDQRKGEEEKKLAELEESVRRLQLQHDVPTEEDLQAARGQRARGWRTVREVWLQGKESQEGVKFIEEVAPGRTLADAYEQSVGRADDTVDRLRREAGRVAEKVNLLAQVDAVRRHINELALQSSEAAYQKKATEQTWLALLKSRGFPELRLSEARKWFQDQGNIVALGARLRDEGFQAERLRKSIDSARGRLEVSLQDLGEPGATTSESLAGLLERAQEVVKQRDRARAARDTTQESLETLERDLLIAQARTAAADQKLMRWQTQWTPLMARLGLGDDASPATANEYLNSIDDLFTRLNSVDHFRRQILGMERECGSFAEAVLSVAGEASPDLIGKPPDDAAHTLQARLASARTMQTERDNLLGQRDKERDRLQEAGRKGSNANLRLQALCKEAKCEAVEDLPVVEERSQRRHALETELRDLEDQLRQFSAGSTVEELVAEAEAIDADSLPSQVQRLEEELAGLHGDFERVNQTIGAEGELLKRMDGNAVAAEAAARGESVLAQLQAEVPRYAALHLASTILKRAVDRYREKNQGPVLDRASTIFADLTVGSFTGLTIDYDEQDKAVLVGVRPDGTHIGVAGMSDGSCDQLYLSVRLATLEVWLQSHDPIPFIVDDILLNFDDERSVAALKALADLSRRTQVIFFTHHRHLLTLGEKHLDHERVFFHHLSRRKGAPETALTR